MGGSVCKWHFFPRAITGLMNWAIILLITFILVGLSCFVDGSPYIGFLAIAYAIVNFAYASCRSSAEDCSHVGAIYDTGVLRFAAWYTSRTLTLFIVTALLFKNALLQQLSRWTIQFIIVLVTIENSHSLYHGDGLILGTYIALLFLSITTGSNPRYNVVWLRVAIGGGMLSVVFRTVIEARNDIHFGLYDALHQVSLGIIAVAVVKAVKAP